MAHLSHPDPELYEFLGAGEINVLRRAAELRAHPLFGVPGPKAGNAVFALMLFWDFENAVETADRYRKSPPPPVKRTRAETRELGTESTRHRAVFVDWKILDLYEKARKLYPDAPSPVLRRRLRTLMRKELANDLRSTKDEALDRRIKRAFERWIRPS